MAAEELKRSRAESIRQALERYLEDYSDLEVTLDRLRDPAEPRSIGSRSDASCSSLIE